MDKLSYGGFKPSSCVPPSPLCWLSFSSNDNVKNYLLDSRHG